MGSTRQFFLLANELILKKFDKRMYLICFYFIEFFVKYPLKQSP